MRLLSPAFTSASLLARRARLALFAPLAPLLPIMLSIGCSSSSPAAADPNACDAVPTPIVAQTDATRALASTSAHCGVAPFTWLSDKSLGDVTARGISDHIVADTSMLLFAQGNVKANGEVHDVDLQQIAYVTQDRGKKIEASALIAWPSDLAGKTQLDVVLLLHGTAGFEDGCAPSNAQDSRPLVAALAALGYVAVAPDYIGLKALGAKTGFLHPYLVGQPTALASLDAVRAAEKLLATDKVRACARPRFATLGGSQGGHAALWVDRLAPYYAQELEHVGVVATVPPADLLGESNRALRSTVPASANMAAFYGAASDWYGVTGKLSEVFLSPLDTKLPADLASTCDPGGDIDSKTITDVFTKSLLDTAASSDGIAKLSPWGCMVVENGLTTTSVKRLAPTAPGYGILFVLGESDTLVDPATERPAFDTLCAQGMKMQYLECAGASHTKATAWALPEIVDFLRDRFAGKPMDAASTCVRAAASKCRGTPS
jgi:dienelactone hydrolase